VVRSSAASDVYKRQVHPNVILTLSIFPVEKG
jgi:hypothetical protein